MPPKKALQRAKATERLSFQLNGLQPPSDGPKLHPFSHRASAIHFVRLLSDPEGEGHSQVFEVTIASKVYALKIFNFYTDAQAMEGLEDSEMGDLDLDLDTFHFHSDPFYSECRAYGKLIETNLNGRVAVRCHGYTTITAKEVHQLAERFQIEEWQLDEGIVEPIDSQDQPYRAVVKDLIRDDVKLTTRIANRMKRDLSAMQKHHIWPYDIKLDNYRAGLLIDLSTAITRPHYWLRVTKSRGQLDMLEFADLVNFDEMIEEANPNIIVRTLPDQRTLKKLRPRITTKDVS
ncbi:MAG: hypothetical protein Q9167_007712 [Letrouitia subvulpina]